MSENEIKPIPVAWTSKAQMESVRDDGDGIMAPNTGNWRHAPGWDIPLYGQPAIDRLTAELNSAREQLAERSEQYRWLQRMHEDECTARRVWADACRQAEAERDAADAERDAAVEAFTRLLTERQS